MKITFDGDPKQYMLDETTGALETYKEPTLQDCKDEVQATGGPVSSKVGTATTQASGVRVDLGKKDFSSGNRFFEKSDTNGRFTAQYGFGKGNPVAFGFDPSAFLEGIATGPASAVATRLPGDCRYSKTQNLNYGWHWSCLNHEPSRLYRMDGDWKFNAKVGGKAAKAEVIWRFNYTVRLV